MAINFEAANMAGYNNPKIEVFEAIMAEDGASCVQYPSKAALLNCLSRGSLPFIMLTSGHDNPTIYVLPLSSCLQSDNNYALWFATINQFSANTGSTVFTLCYSEGNEHPEILAHEIPAGNI